MTAPFELFASCSPGLEPLLEAELSALGALQPKSTAGGVRFRGHRRLIYRVNLESGLATHVLLRVAQFTARYFDTLEQQLAGIDWARYLAPGVARKYRVSARKSRLHHTGAIEERTDAAITRQLREAKAGDDPVPIAIRLDHDNVQVSIDTSGAPLHRRGYRQKGGPAPLREDLARALILASGWDPSTPLCDPLCGAGTIPIEAALIAQGLAPGRLRSFAFQRTPLFHRETWQDVLSTSKANERPGPTIIARDRDRVAVAATAANAVVAGVTLRVEQAPLSAPITIGSSDAAEAGAGALVTHPPFGRRMGSASDLAPLYRAIGRARPEGWQLGLITADRKLGMQASRSLCTAFLTDAGGIKVRALCSVASPNKALTRRRKR